MNAADDYLEVIEADKGKVQEALWLSYRHKPETDYSLELSWETIPPPINDFTSNSICTTDQCTHTPTKGRSLLIAF